MKIPPEEILHEVIIRALQMTLNAWKRYLREKQEERLKQDMVDISTLSDKERVYTPRNPIRELDAVGTNGGKASVEHIKN